MVITIKAEGPTLQNGKWELDINCRAPNINSSFVGLAARPFFSGRHRRVNCNEATIRQNMEWSSLIRKGFVSLGNLIRLNNNKNIPVCVCN